MSHITPLKTVKTVNTEKSDKPLKFGKMDKFGKHEKIKNESDQKSFTFVIDICGKSFINLECSFIIYKTSNNNY